MSEWTVVRSGSDDVLINIKSPIWLDDDEALQLAKDIEAVATRTENHIQREKDDTDE